MRFSSGGVATFFGQVAVPHLALELKDKLAVTFDGECDRPLSARFIRPTLLQPSAERPALLFSGKVLLVFNALQRAGVKHQNKEPHMPWLANTFWQLLLSLALFCCKHC